jgi:acetyl/propionyl-CoA carboxylase alpha subunit
VRVDCGVDSGYTVPREYDPMIAKVIVWAQDRERARRRLLRALENTAFKGVATNNYFLRRLLDSEAFKSGAYHTGTIADIVASGPPAIPTDLLDVATVAAVVHTYHRDTRTTREINKGDLPRPIGWRQAGWRGGGG